MTGISQAFLDSDGKYTMLYTISYIICTCIHISHVYMYMNMYTRISCLYVYEYVHTYLMFICICLHISHVYMYVYKYMLYHRHVICRCLDQV